MIYFLIFVFLVVFCFCACTLAKDADDKLEKMQSGEPAIFIDNKEEKKMKLDDFCRSLPDPENLEEATEDFVKVMGAVQEHFAGKSVKIREILDFLKGLQK